MRVKTGMRRFAESAALLVLLVPLLAVADQSNVLWRIGKDGHEVGYLLGTVHSDDERVLAFSEEFEAALISCDTFAMELVPDQPTLTRLLEYMQYSDGTTLVDHVGEERFARLVKAAKSYGFGEDQIARMKVWAAMMTVSLPPPKNGLFMDFALALQSAGSGLRVIGLESLEEQLEFLEKMSIEHQLMMLDQALDEFENLHKTYEQLIDSYLTLDLETLVKESRDQLSDLPEEVVDHFESQGIVARNLRMAGRLETDLQEGKVFVAVGALHLPGESGLITLLRDSGYTVEPVDFSPFAKVVRP